MSDVCYGIYKAYVSPDTIMQIMGGGIRAAGGPMGYRGAGSSIWEQKSRFAGLCVGVVVTSGDRVRRQRDVSEEHTTSMFRVGN
jgi:hypothetical protein